MYADALYSGITAKQADVEVVEERPSKAVDELKPYHGTNHLCANQSNYETHNVYLQHKHKAE